MNCQALFRCGLENGRWANLTRRISRRGQRGVYSSAFRPPCVLFLRVLVVVALVLAAPHLAFASGEERTTVGDDLVIRTDTRWAGGTLGGYLPVRVEIANQAPARKLVFEVTPADRARGDGQAGRRRGSARDGPFHAFHSAHGVPTGAASRLRPARRTAIARASHWGRGDVRRRVGACDARGLVPARRLLGLHQGGQRLAATSAASACSSESSAIAEVVPPDSLPDSWIDYSGLDFVAISRDELADLKPSSRSAILKWVHCGGNLIVHQAGKTSKDVETLERLLEMPENAAVGARWTESDRRKTSSPFSTRQLMLGLVCAFPDQLPDSPVGWSAFLSSVGGPRFSWMQRHGVMPDVGTEEFFNFMNPGIRGVPVYGFMVLITAFAVLIGPVNYFYLRNKRLLWLLLVTVPATALVTSVLLVGYSVAAHGFSVRSRIRSLTVLDQKSHEAVTVARLALFAGVAPRAACSFPRKRPSIRCSRQRPSRALSRSTGPRTQALTSGWLLSRTRTQFLTIRHAEEPACRDQAGTRRGPRNRQRIALGAGGRARG